MIYVLDPQDPDYAIATRAAIAVAVSSGFAFAVSRRARPRTPLWATLPTAVVGVVTPIVALYALLAISCPAEGCFA